MPFMIIKGTFVPRPPGIPDGDTIRFRPDDPDLIYKLQRRRYAPSLNNEDIISLRYEGIDAPERGSREPFACDATARNIEYLGLSDVYDEGQRGYILARQLDIYGRPISFVFAGEATEEDGDHIHLEADRMQESVNFRLIESGVVYPLFYDSLFVDLRTAIVEATVFARNDGRGFWPHDRTTQGVTCKSENSLSLFYPIFPKLWRRLSAYWKDKDCGDDENPLGVFIDFLKFKETKERLFILSESRFTDFDNIITVSGDTVKISYHPEDLIFTSK